MGSAYARFGDDARCADLVTVRHRRVLPSGKASYHWPDRWSQAPTWEGIRGANFISTNPAPGSNSSPGGPFAGSKLAVIMLD